MANSLIPPHIQDNLDWTYSSKEYREYILKILNDSREGERNGFPPVVAKELILLLVEHDQKFPQHIPKLKPWDIA